MQIAIVGAGFTPSESDRLRRAMATFKRVGTIHTFRAKFIDGMVANGYAREFAERCFKQIEGFGTYGFPESHAASFALLVYVSSWLKCHFPELFACALLNSQPMGFYAPAQIVRDARDHGVVVLPVDVNASAWDCTLEVAAPPADVSSLSPLGISSLSPSGASSLSPSGASSLSPSGASSLSPSGSSRSGPTSVVGPEREEPEDDNLGAAEGGDGMRPRFALRLGFRQVKGLREEEMAELVARRGRGYADLADLRRRAGRERRRPRSSGAGRCLHLARPRPARRPLERDRPRSHRPRARPAAAVRLGPRPTGRPPPPTDRPPPVAAAKGWTAPAEPEVALPRMTLGHEVAEDYANLRMSLRAHPLALLRPMLDPRIVRAERLARIANGRRVEVAGLTLVRQRPGTASGVIFITLEDESGIANLVVWPKVFERFRRVVLGAQLLIVRGPAEGGPRDPRDRRAPARSHRPASPSGRDRSGARRPARPRRRGQAPGRGRPARSLLRPRDLDHFRTHPHIYRGFFDQPEAQSAEQSHPLVPTRRRLQIPQLPLGHIARRKIRPVSSCSEHPHPTLPIEGEGVSLLAGPNFPPP